MNPQRELEILIHRHRAVVEYWDKILNSVQMSCSGIYDWIDD